MSETLAALRARVERAKALQAQRLAAYNAAHERVLCCDVCGMPALEGAARCTVHVEAPEHAAPKRVRACEYCRERAATGVWELSGRAFGRVWKRREALCASCGFSASERRIMTPCPYCQIGISPARHKCERSSVRYVLACELVASGLAAAGAHVPVPKGAKRRAPPELAEIRTAMLRVRAALAKFQRAR